MNPHGTQSPDTAVGAESRQFAIWRGMSDEETLRLFGELCDSVRYLAEIGLRDLYQDASDREICMRLFSTWLDRQTVIQGYNWDPLEH